MRDLSIANNMEANVIQGLDNTDMSERLGAINRAASKPQSSELESEAIKMGVAETVKKLEKETKEMSPDKENVADVVISENNGTSMMKEDTEKTILGMKPLTLGLFSVGILVAGYFAYKHFKGKKK